MRSAEDAQDYRYFDPDLLPLIITDADIERVRAQRPRVSMRYAKSCARSTVDSAATLRHYRFAGAANYSSRPSRLKLGYRQRHSESHSRPLSSPPESRKPDITKPHCLDPIRKLAERFF
jgi:hypothetical protein